MLHIVSYRSPYLIAAQSREVVGRANLGGVVFSLEWLLSRYGGRWISMGGFIPPKSDRPFQTTQISPSNKSYTLEMVTLPERDARLFYAGICNRAIWPLFHGAPDKCAFRQKEWACYLHVNNIFSNVVRKATKMNDVIWVHDFHFAMSGHYLRREQYNGPLLFFWHIPFPGLETTCRLPWIKKLVEGILAYDTIGFHTPRYLNNFLDATAFFLNVKANRERQSVIIDGRRVNLFAAPVGIDFETFDQHATMSLSKRTAGSSSEFVFLGVDRQDYAKGIIEKLSAFQFLLDRYPELLGKVKLIQIAAPSRTDVSGYGRLGTEIQNLAAATNQRYATPDWAPVEIIDECVDRMSLIRYYRSADALIVNSLADGLNLVSLEFIASRCDEKGILLLSRCAGAADYLKSGSLLINPRNKQDIAMQMKRAIDMSDLERMVRMQQLRSTARKFTVRRWSNSMLAPLLGTHAELTGCFGGMEEQYILAKQR